MDFTNKIKPEIIFESWRQLPEDMCDSSGQDFQEIHGLANKGGVEVILGLARNDPDNLAAKFNELDSFIARAFWTFLEKQKYFNDAMFLRQADKVRKNSWREHNNCPKIDVDISEANISKFAQTLGLCFGEQGRGKNCKVDHYRRNDLDYFFAHPEDYSRANMEWDNGKFIRRSYRPAFEVIFIYSKDRGKLDIYVEGSNKLVEELQEIFTDVILHEVFTPNTKDNRVYNLVPLLNRNFQFIFNHETGITEIIIKKLRLKKLNTNDYILLEANTSRDKYAVYDLLDQLTKVIPLAMLALIKAEIQVIFAPNVNSMKENKHTFNISFPNSCSLKHDGDDLIIRKILQASNIEQQEQNSK